MGLTVTALFSSGPASAQVFAINPVQPVAPFNSAIDPSHGFLVLVEEDAALLENETEGTVAIGGDLSFRDYRVGLNESGDYVIPPD
nr:hypothetical protein [Micromonospora sp. DSM 115978]